MRPDRSASVASAVAIVLLVAGCGDRGKGAAPASESTSERSGGETTALSTGETGAGAQTTSGAPGVTGAQAASGSPGVTGAEEPAAKETVTLIAGGDVCLGRLLGQTILRDPGFNPFASSARILGTADIRFVNLESQLSDQKGETQSPTMKLKFTGPPGGGKALAAGRIDVVSAANNHMWDYGKDAFFQTLDNLEKAGVKYAGAGRTRDQAYGPVIVEAGGRKVAFLAFTGIWNQSELRFHEAKDHVAEAQRQSVVESVRAARAKEGVDFVVVSYHGGEEYVSVPLQLAVDLHRAAIDAGADAVIGHHPHVAQGIEVYKGKPIFYSLGNYLMRTHGEHTETGIGFLAKIGFSKAGAPSAWVCPFRISGFVASAIPLADDPQRKLYEAVYHQRIRVVQGSIASPAAIGPMNEDGCATVSERRR